MKKMLFVVILGLLGNCFGDTRWLTKEEQIRQGIYGLWGREIIKHGVCDTKEEAQEASGLENLSDYLRDATEILSPPSRDMFFVDFLEDGNVVVRWVTPNGLVFTYSLYDL